MHRSKSGVLILVAALLPFTVSAQPSIDSGDLVFDTYVPGPCSPNGQMLQRVAFNQPEPQAERRESLFMELGRRFRHVVQGPDGYLYVATFRRIPGPSAPVGSNRSGIVLRIEPAD